MTGRRVILEHSGKRILFGTFKDGNQFFQGMDVVRKDFPALEFEDVVPEIFQNLFRKDFLGNFFIDIFDEPQPEPLVFRAGNSLELFRNLKIDPVPE